MTCVRGGDNTTVEGWHCTGSSTRKPVSWETCHVPCESDCQLSEWSHWSHCHGDCLKDTSGNFAKLLCRLTCFNVSQKLFKIIQYLSTAFNSLKFLGKVSNEYECLCVNFSPR